jgi:hypothetical protein
MWVVPLIHTPAISSPSCSEKEEEEHEEQEENVTIS